MPDTPTVYDVAEHANVSIATVSRVLRRPEDVRASTQERVLAAVRELGYVPSGSARSLAARKTGVLGLYLPTIDAADELPATMGTHPEIVDVRLDPAAPTPRSTANLYFEEVLRGCELEAWRHGFSLMISVGRGRAESSIGGALSDLAGRVDGLAVIAHSTPDEVLKRLPSRIPVVVLAGGPVGDNFDHVTVNNRAGMRALTQHLIEAHKIVDPLYIAGPRDSPDNVERYAGFCDALTTHGHNPSSSAVLHGEFSRERAQTIARQLISRGTLPQAIVCANDQMALGITDVLLAAHINIPDDVIVTGFDGLSETARSTPRLTTVVQPMLDVGRAAVQTLVARLEDTNREPMNLQLPVAVLLRESCEGPLTPAHEHHERQTQTLPDKLAQDT